MVSILCTKIILVPSHALLYAQSTESNVYSIGKTYNCEWTLFARFNSERKIVQARLYIDSNALNTLAISGGYNPADVPKA